MIDTMQVGSAKMKWHERSSRIGTAGTPANCARSRKKDPAQKKLRALVHVEFEAARTHPQEFPYFCENEAQFLRGLRHDIPRVRHELIKILRKGQAAREVRSGDPGLLADMLSGALCGAAISAIMRKDLQMLENEELAVESCWQMLRRNIWTRGGGILLHRYAS
jgi:hypothetical protein